MSSDTLLERIAQLEKHVYILIKINKTEFTKESTNVNKEYEERKKKLNAEMKKNDTHTIIQQQTARRGAHQEGIIIFKSQGFRLIP